ncbi:hypothetical protein [Caenimonas aquaedulcis]|uniref:Uncharacterized protein n=1 Tax=Caenimonas aquaedulcis TaxID=2793270 RepID=A0A931H3V7_9BURK|nr:hypothetical protein [Caenimonas aquaedulcis]MBG9388032.1 hypothetical protein [Caenimonas aquaedulcis]
MSVQDNAGPIQPNDDLLGHQTPARMSRPAMADTAEAIFTERYWYMGASVPDGRTVFGAGLGYYPNRGVMDGYAGFTLDGVQHSFRASRRLGANPLETRIGPLSIEVGEGLGVHRIRLAPNDSGLAMDIEYRASHAPNDEGRDVLEKSGRVVADVTRFVQFGHYTGWVEAQGQRREFDRQPLWGARDRSWGLRVEARTDESHPPVTRFKPLFFGWVCAQFEDRGIHFFLKESAPGETRFFVGDETAPLGRPADTVAIVGVEHELEWADDAYSQHLAGGVFHLRYADGTRKALKLRALPAKFYLKAGLYGGLDGWFQGDDRGALHTDHTRWDHADPETRRKLRTLAEQPMQFELDGRIGYGTIQCGLSAGYPRYPQVQHLPVM